MHMPQCTSDPDGVPSEKARFKCLQAHLVHHLPALLVGSSRLSTLLHTTHGASSHWHTSSHAHANAPVSTAGLGRHCQSRQALQLHATCLGVCTRCSHLAWPHAILHAQPQQQLDCWGITAAAASACTLFQVAAGATTQLLLLLLLWQGCTTTDGMWHAPAPGVCGGPGHPKWPPSGGHWGYTDTATAPLPVCMCVSKLFPHSRQPATTPRGKGEARQAGGTGRLPAQHSNCWGAPPRSRQDSCQGRQAKSPLTAA
jgi:hypothetical protein